MYYLPFLLFLSALGIAGNQLLIPYLGINGAALAKVITYVVFGLILTSFVYYKLKIHPLSINHLKLLGIIAAVLVINFILPVLENNFLDALYRTIIVATIGVVAVYYFNISPQANQIANNFLKRFRK